MMNTNNSANDTEQGPAVHLISFLGLSDRRATGASASPDVTLEQTDVGPLLRLLACQPQRIGVLHLIDDTPAGEVVAHVWIDWAQKLFRGRGLAMPLTVNVLKRPCTTVHACCRAIADVWASVPKHSTRAWVYHLSSGTAAMTVGMTLACQDSEHAGQAALVDRAARIEWIDPNAMRVPILRQ